ncbi:hypothetical protein EDB89DRAFT_318050 [Lactarius sanguifluus]|nr:hypothetical protein EDB89DRAFT_318050 [Lactarius sanguifluus]
MSLTRSSTTFSPHLCVRISRISHCSTSSAFCPPARLASLCSTAPRPRGCARSWPSAAQHDATRRQHGVRRPSSRGALKVLVPVLAPDMDGTHARAVVRSAGKYGRGARASRTVSSDAGLVACAVQAGRLAVFERPGASHTPPAGHAGDRGYQGGRKPVTSRTVGVESAEIGITLRRFSFGGTRETRAGGMNQIHVRSFLFSFFLDFFFACISLSFNHHTHYDLMFS